MRASVSSDGMHSTVLVDKLCKGSVSLTWPVSAEHNPDIEALDTAIFRRGCVGTSNKHIDGTFHGTFVWEPEKSPSRFLKVEAIRHLRVQIGGDDCGRGR